MTLTDPNNVASILRNGCEDEGFTFKTIYSYKTGTGKTCYALFLDYTQDDMNTSPYVNDVVCLAANGILTDEGNQFLERMN